ncbi:hypothetical protein Taro_043764 [Colocasia esculenta]|uniref:Uncharacterized protein n=1 Tax=Colocasia esculenta TaxID=4460 RepID=A0A843WSW3_COLES|nr:hypothetical protein [Colocasia esculenta]
MLYLVATGLLSRCPFLSRWYHDGLGGRDSTDVASSVSMVPVGVSACASGLAFPKDLQVGNETVYGGTSVCGFLTSRCVWGSGWFCLWALDLVEVCGFPTRFVCVLQEGCSYCYVACVASIVARCVHAVVARLVVDSLAVVFPVWRTVAGKFSVCRVASLVERCDTYLWLLVGLVLAGCELWLRCIAWLPCVLGLRYVVVLVGVFWRVCLELCLGGSGGGFPRIGLRCFCSSACCGVLSEVCRLVGLHSGEVLPRRLLALLVEVLLKAALCSPIGVGMLVPVLSPVCAWRVCYQLFVGSPLCMVLIELLTADSRVVVGNYVLCQVLLVTEWVAGQSVPTVRSVGGYRRVVFAWHFLLFRSVLALLSTCGVAVPCCHEEVVVRLSDFSHPHFVCSARRLGCRRLKALAGDPFSLFLLPVSSPPPPVVLHLPLSPLCISGEEEGCAHVLGIVELAWSEEEPWDGASHGSASLLVSRASGSVLSQRFGVVLFVLAPPIRLVLGTRGLVPFKGCLHCLGSPSLGAFEGAFGATSVLELAAELANSEAEGKTRKVEVGARLARRGSGWCVLLLAASGGGFVVVVVTVFPHDVSKYDLLP